MEIGQYQPNLDGDGLRIGIVQSRFNEPVCNGLVDACTEELERLGVIGEDVLTTENDEQAVARMTEKGRDAARVAVEMANLSVALEQLGGDDEDEDEEDRA
jgi:6,7-dimethyl-8-ribityllumazine synthase